VRLGHNLLEIAAISETATIKDLLITLEHCLLVHLDGDIWELRPLDNRILFAYYKDNLFILLHHFNKKTNKTPTRELDQAKRNLADYLERNDI